MASIVNNPKYTEGHQIVLKEQKQITSATALKAFRDNGYSPGSSKFALYKPTAASNIDKFIFLGSGNEIIFLKDHTNKIVQLRGTKESIQKSFNHVSSKAADTNKLTEIKENISMWVIKHYNETNNIISEDTVINMLDFNLKDLYQSLYYESALKQLAAFKSYVPSNKKRNYTYERQGKNRSKNIYDTARKLTNKHPDNWNPADVWMIHKDYDVKKISEQNHVKALNGELRKAFYDKDIIPISLKQVVKETGAISIIDPESMITKKSDLNFKYVKASLTESFNNFSLETESGYMVRAGYKTSRNNVNMEGRIKGAGSALGAIDAKAYKDHVKHIHNYDLRNGSNTPVNDINEKLALNEARIIFSKYRNVSNKIKSYDDLVEIYHGQDFFTKQKFINLISFLYSFLICPLNDNKWDEHFQYSYYLAKKITNDSSVYLLLN